MSLSNVVTYRYRWTKLMSHDCCMFVVGHVLVHKGNPTRRVVLRTGTHIKGQHSRNASPILESNLDCWWLGRMSELTHASVDIEQRRKCRSLIASNDHLASVCKWEGRSSPSYWLVLVWPANGQWKLAWDIRRLVEWLSHQMVLCNTTGGWFRYLPLLWTKGSQGIIGAFCSLHIVLIISVTKFDPEGDRDSSRMQGAFAGWSIILIGTRPSKQCASLMMR